MNKKFLKKGTEIFPSTLGHKNFHYPILDKGFLLEKDLEAELLAYSSGSSSKENKRLTAFKVKDIIGNKNESIVIWTWKKT